MPEHDFELPYHEHYLGEVEAEFTQGFDDASRAITVEGRCPRCHGHTASEYSWGTPGTGTKGLFPLRRRQPEVPDLLHEGEHFCECGYPHPDEPAEPTYRGCGASWRVKAGTPAEGDRA